MHYFTCRVVPTNGQHPAATHAVLLIQFKDRWGAERLRDAYLDRAGYRQDDSWRGVHKEYPAVEFNGSRGLDHPLNAVASVGFTMLFLQVVGDEDKRVEARLKESPLGVGGLTELIESFLATRTMNT